MSAWDELQTWLIMNVGSKEAEEASAIVLRIIEEEREACAKIADERAAIVWTRRNDPLADDLASAGALQSATEIARVIRDRSPLSHVATDPKDA